MSDPSVPESPSNHESIESFKDLLTQFEKGHPQKRAEGGGREGTVITVTADSVLVDGTSSAAYYRVIRLR